MKHLFPFIYFIGCVDNWTKVVFTQSKKMFFYSFILLVVENFIGYVDNWTKVVFAQSKKMFFHSFILLVLWTIGQRWYSLNPPKQFPLICSTPSPHGYKFIFKWVVWVQLLKWWVKFFYTAKT